MRWLKSLIICTLFCAVLVAAAVWHYYSPGQAHKRLQAHASSLLGVPVRLQGCESGFLRGGVRVARLDVPAFPIVRSGTLLTLEKLAQRHPADLSAPAVRLRMVLAPTDVEPRRFDIARAVLRLEYQPHLTHSSSARGSWNTVPLAHAAADPVALERSGYFSAFVDECSVSVERYDADGSVDSLAVRFEDVEVSRTSNGQVLAVGDLTEGPHWVGGALTVRVAADESVAVSGRIDDLRLGDERWERLVPIWSALTHGLSLDGTVDVDLDSLRLSVSGIEQLEATLRSYGAHVTLGHGDLQLRNVRGSLSVTDQGVRSLDVTTNGVTERQAPLEADLWGVPVRVSGVSDAGSARWDIDLPATSLQEATQATRPTWSTTLADVEKTTRVLEQARAEGEIAGGIKAEIRDGAVDRWIADFLVTVKSFGAWPWLENGRAIVQLKSVRGHTEGSLDVHSLTWRGVGRLSGQASVQATKEQLTLSMPELRVSDASAEPLVVGPREATEQDTSGGKIFGSVSWNWGTGISAVDLRWVKLALDSPDVAIGRLDGAVSSGANDAITGRFDLADVSLSTRLFSSADESAPDNTPWEFERGSGQVRLQEGEIHLLGLKILGERRTVRLRGKRHVSGDLDCVVVLSPDGGAAYRDDRLDAAAVTEWWRAAGEGRRAYRLTGRIGSLKTRQLGPGELAFIKL